jgi:hypothetical protein
MAASEYPKMRQHIASRQNPMTFAVTRILHYLVPDIAAHHGDRLSGVSVGWILPLGRVLGNTPVLLPGTNPGARPIARSAVCAAAARGQVAHGPALG